MTNGIKIDYTKDDLLSEEAKILMKEYYMLPEEKSPQEAFARAARAYGSSPDLAQRIYNYASDGWFMFASPVLSNAERKGMPISCFLADVPDTVDGLLEHYEETARLSVAGGGVGGHWSEIRAVDSKSPGPIPFISNINSAMTSWKQGETRKGAYAAYLDISHPDIVEFSSIRVPTGGDVNRKCFNIHNAINITDDFMQAVLDGEEWNLKCPHTGEVKNTIDARELFSNILETRFRTGEPYLNFIDEANRKLNPFLKEKGLKIKGSNLCNEIHLPTNEERTAVCCLSSVNLAYFPEWRDTRMVADLVRYLDDVLDYFINNAPSSLSKAVESAKAERSIGLGAMGWHSYLQRKMVPFDIPIAISHTRNIFKTIKDQAVESSRELARERGEPSDIKGSGMRHSHLLAVAPNANSSIICGCSPSIEPYSSNSFPRRTRIGTHLVENPYLIDLLKDKNPDKVDLWMKQVRADGGSVLNLDCLSEYEKDVFRTFEEIDMHSVVDLAAHRQEFICQGQSLNLSFPEGSSREYVLSVHIRAWMNELKGLYYLRTSSGARADEILSQKARVSLASIINQEECLACSG